MTQTWHANKDMKGSKCMLEACREANKKIDMLQRNRANIISNQKGPFQQDPKPHN